MTSYLVLWASPNHKVNDIEEEEDKEEEEEEEEENGGDRERTKLQESVPPNV